MQRRDESAMLNTEILSILVPAQENQSRLDESKLQDCEDDLFIARPKHLYREDYGVAARPKSRCTSRMRSSAFLVRKNEPLRVRQTRPTVVIRSNYPENSTRLTTQFTPRTFSFLRPRRDSLPSELVFKYSTRAIAQFSLSLCCSTVKTTPPWTASRRHSRNARRRAG